MIWNGAKVKRGALGQRDPMGSGELMYGGALTVGLAGTADELYNLEACAEDGRLRQVLEWLAETGGRQPFGSFDKEA